MRLASLLVLAVVVFACGSEETGGEMAGSESAVEGSDVSSGYQVILGNAVTDTLRGEAGYGIVTESDTGAEQFVIRLASDFDFAGGFILARRDTMRPSTGTYSLDAEADSLAGAPADAFMLFYREGMLRDMRAASGSLELTIVTDSLIVGTFDAVLRGRVASLDRSSGADVHAVGRFRAGRDLDGFVIGL